LESKINKAYNYGDGSDVGVYIKQAPSSLYFFYLVSDNLSLFYNTHSSSSIYSEMLSFRSILFATVVFATLASAIPITPETSSTGVSTNVLGGLTSGELVPAAGSPLKRGQFSRKDDCGDDQPSCSGSLPFYPGKGGKGPFGRGVIKRGQPSCGDIIKKYHDDIAVIVVKIGQSFPFLFK
jgi:hypothetical protein